ncbi:MAG: LysR family transcriptional regulator [Pseudomonadota bacterium]
MTKIPRRKHTSDANMTPSWDRAELRFVLEAATTKSFNKVAENLKVSHSTVTERIGRLEERLGYKIFDRSPKGVFLTVRGLSIIAEVRQAFMAVEKLEHTAANIDTPNRSHIRISITDGLATFWLAPKIRHFHDDHPDISLECSIGELPADPFLTQTDLSVRMRAPDTEEFVVRELGHLHFIPYASKAYLEKYGTPRDVYDLASHTVVDHASYGHTQGPWYAWQNASRLPGPTTLRTNVGAMTVTAVEHGAGIGVLPSYVSLISDKLVPLDLGIYMRSELYLCYLRATGDNKAKRAVANWLQTAFSPSRYPCFRTEYVHPNDFGKTVPSKSRAAKT